jgi:hypothetical protein
LDGSLGCARVADCLTRDRKERRKKSGREGESGSEKERKWREWVSGWIGKEREWAVERRMETSRGLAGE